MDSDKDQDTLELKPKPLTLRDLTLGHFTDQERIFLMDYLAYFKARSQKASEQRPLPLSAQTKRPSQAKLGLANRYGDPPSIIAQDLSRFSKEKASD
ncbi:MAG: hypothetical protein LBE80_01010 [Deltaproteobacteria bacterium]|jgi:hypothetical protein|nr:hypothetical protein [Deltaproteobacteria bacterium]